MAVELTKLLQEAYAAIGEKTPLTTDCGALCSAACCSVDEDGQGGVALLPAEEAQLQDIDWGEISFDPHMERPMLMCSDFCDRSLRPFLCRIFPLCPVIGKSGKWTVRMDARARAVCPLTRGGLNGLDPDFVRGCAKAVQILASHPDGEAFLQKWAAIEEQFRKPLF